MKKKLFIFLAVLAVVTCICAISVSAVTPNNDGEVFVAADKTTLALYDTEGKALAWFYDSTNSTYVPYRVGIDFTMALNSGRELLPSTVISDTDGDANTTFPYTVSNMILLNGRDYSAFTYISGTWQNLPIQAIYVNNNFAWINKQCFNNNATLKVFDIPKDHDVYLHIGPAFVKANALESFYVPKKGEFEGTSTFEYSTGLKYVEFHDQWEYELKGFEFNGCTALESAKLPSTITIIPKALFRDCKSLTSVVIPSGVTKIDGELTRSDRGAFVGCTSLTTITIPASVTFIGGYAFASSGLVSIVFEERTLQYDKDGNLTNGLSMEQYAAFENCKSLEELILPEGLTNIGNCFAKGCSALTKLSLPSTLSAWGGGSQHFYGTALTEVIGLENTKITYLPSEIFRGLRSWKPEVLKLPNTCTTLQSYALADVGMQTLYLGASFEKLEGNHPLTGCSSLKTIYAPACGTSLTLGNSGTQLVFVTSTAENVISAFKTSTGISATMTYADYLAGKYTSGKCIITGYNLCDAFYDGHLEGGEETCAWTGDKFLSNYKITCPCGRNCGSENVIKDLAPLFTTKGYSTSGSAMMQAFAINKSLWESEYSVLFPELKYGMVAAYKGANDSGFDTTSGKIVNADCTGINTKVAIVDMTERDYDVFEIKISGVGAEDYKATTFFLCAYVVLDGTVYYIDNGTTGESAKGASYNDVEAFVSPEYGYVGKEEE